MRKIIVAVFIISNFCCRNRVTNDYFKNDSFRSDISYENYRENQQIKIVKFFKKVPQDTCLGNYFLQQYYPSGEIESRGQIKNYKKIGFWESWHENGNKSSEEYYNINGYLSVNIKAGFQMVKFWRSSHILYLIPCINSLSMPVCI